MIVLGLGINIYWATLNEKTSLLGNISSVLLSFAPSFFLTHGATICFSSHLRLSCYCRGRLLSPPLILLPLTITYYFFSKPMPPLFFSPLCFALFSIFSAGWSNLCVDDGCCGSGNSQGGRLWKVAR